MFKYVVYGFLLFILFDMLRVMQDRREKGEISDSGAEEAYIDLADFYNDAEDN